ncbi:type II toxin-antitoxin system VapC family toxin [Enterovirga aerilata]|uniref:Ribonuclease VapC n=1 Tax=Enterovirga aerilata TaxID=2730920 RepID=A0A849IET1_9HYPH|nr:type II toxin-antitoxin system VapC family toxin [Enterovirga sp. DB1703]NNM74477.1 type II toxin-antitoxin system VapC family toxin [Enterovirga sp. DB1703]
MPPVLLDTCAAIWLAAGAGLRAEAAGLIEATVDRGGPVLVSPITAWEVALLVSRGRPRLDIPPQTWFERLIAAPGIRVAPLEPRVLVASHVLPGRPPNDPADRIIAAAAREFNATLVTRDRLLLAYGLEGHVRVQAC